MRKMTDLLSLLSNSTDLTLWALPATAWGLANCSLCRHWAVHNFAAFAHKTRPLVQHEALRTARILCQEGAAWVQNDASTPRHLIECSYTEFNIYSHCVFWWSPEFLSISVGLIFGLSNSSDRTTSLFVNCSHFQTAVWQNVHPSTF